MSRAGHVVSCLNTGGPSPKAKYYLVTDSEPEGSEKEPETVYVQAVGARLGV